MKIELNDSNCINMNKVDKILSLSVAIGYCHELKESAGQEHLNEKLKSIIHLIESAQSQALKNLTE